MLVKPKRIRRWRRKPHDPVAPALNPKTDETAEEPGFSVLGAQRTDAEDRLRMEFTKDPQFQAIQGAIQQQSEALKAITEMETLTDLYNDQRGWDQIGPGIHILPEYAANRIRVLKQCFYLYYRNPLARNIIRAYTHLTLGKGMVISFHGRGAPAARKRWEVIAKNNNWEVRYRDLVCQTYLLGEWFNLRTPLLANKFWNKKNGRSDKNARAAYLLKVDPENIWFNSISPLEVLDIITSDVNREIPMHYKVSPNVSSTYDSTNSKNSWPAFFWTDDVTHFKIDDIGMGRGRPILEPVLRDITYYHMWKLDRVMLNSIRARIPLVRKVPGGPGRKASVRSAMQTAGMPRPGTIFIVDKEEEWQALETPQDAMSANRDGRALLLQIASGVGLPENMVSSDASGGTFSSLIASASPLVPLIEGYRRKFEAFFMDFIEDLCGMRPEIGWPSVITESILANTQALSIQYRDGTLSKATYAMRAGNDWETEKENIVQDQAEAAANMDRNKKNATEPTDATATDYTRDAGPMNNTYKDKDKGSTLPNKPHPAGIGSNPAPGTASGSVPGGFIGRGSPGAPAGGSGS